ncbi:MAG TPA: beta-ketoacyl-[acyl-carrier-protein] synthase family protein [Candidatus Brocadiia bacterium]|nr:beta-ketoacyl-[acyl-carrier-protein] synthase family protein [Candidatus Brocadiales bacterium]
MRVVVTGLGLVTPIGIGVKESWNSMVNGKDGATEVTYFDTSKYRVHRACQVRSLESCKFPENNIKRNTIYKYTYLAAKEALEDSGIPISGGDINRERFGIAVGTLAAELPVFEDLLRVNHQNKANGFDTDVAAIYPPSSITSSLAEDFGIEGPSLIMINACSSGNHAIAWAYDLIQMGKADAVLVGGGELIPQTEFTHFHNLKSLAPERCQPFDKNRQGLMIGEGAGMMVLESMEFASKRGANIYAEMMGYGMSSDGYHMTAPHPDGDGAIRAANLALSASGLSYKDVDYVNAHGTGTPLNDKMETLAVKAVFKERAKEIPCSSIKSMIGHTMGAASAIESVACCLTIRDGVIPPTINYETPDPECDIDCVPNKARELKVKYVMNNSFAFGGNNVAIIFGGL